MRDMSNYGIPAAFVAGITFWAGVGHFSYNAISDETKTSLKEGFCMALSIQKCINENTASEPQDLSYIPAQQSGGPRSTPS